MDEVTGWCPLDYLRAPRPGAPFPAVCTSMNVCVSSDLFYLLPQALPAPIDLVHRSFARPPQAVGALFAGHLAARFCISYPPYPSRFFLLIRSLHTYHRPLPLFAANRAPRANSVCALSGPASPLLRAPSSPPAVALVCPSSHLVPLSYTRTSTNPSHAADQTAVCPAISVNPFSCIALRPAYIAHACLASSLGFDDPHEPLHQTFYPALRQAPGDLDLTYVRGTLHIVYHLLVNVECAKQSCA